MPKMTPDNGAEEPDSILHGPEMIWGVLAISLATFMVALDLTIVNVSLPHIASGFAASPHEVTIAITCYAAAQAIVTPMTGWLTNRFGIVRVYLASIAGFGFASFLCGASPSLELLIASRIIQGAFAGPILPLIQALLQRSVPRASMPVAFAVWGLILGTGPLLGPTLGGLAADTVGWPWSFFINLPLAVLCIVVGWKVFGPRDTLKVKGPVDVMGFVLLIVWVGAFQLILDKGREYEWFASPVIMSAAVAGVVCFIAFLIWEFTEKHPLIDFSVFQYRSFYVCVPITSLCFAAQTCGAVLLALWLQTAMNYTATWTGIAAASLGVAGIAASPVVAWASKAIDLRLTVFLAMIVTGLALLWRGTFTAEVNFGVIVIPQLIYGFSGSFSYGPLMALAMSDVPKAKLPAAAGMMTFCRTLTMGFFTAVMTSAWISGASVAHSDIAGRLTEARDPLLGLGVGGLPAEQGVRVLNEIVDRESVVLSTQHVLTILAAIIIGAAAFIWFARQPKPEEPA